ncbi:conjugative transposon protein TraM [Tenacibaculum agarivorans]|uniref:conjugative transposon protein TraM n=1 Tax=Tenacibaculum agarivorans TaxID=1908389 RepID=UPI0013566DB3|nr:conjugative transposon protein TraM [Tenacibaculum agarivorans]
MILAIVLISLPKSSDNGDFPSFENEIDENSFTYEDLMNSEKGNTFSTEDANDFYTQQTTEQTPITEDDIYANENSDAALQMQKAIQELEAERRRIERQNTIAIAGAQNTSTPATIDITSERKTSKPALSEEEKHLQYLERLEKDELSKSAISKSNSPEFITVRAVIFGDQYILPTDRLELILNEPLTIKGKTFLSGTSLFAYISINQTRVMLDIANIEGVPLEIRSYDAYDYREGIYSKRAGELWRAYKQAQEDTAREEASEAISESTGNRLLGNAIRDVGSFFKSLKLRKQEKILLHNDHQVNLKIKY